jgi:hypothetical protein
MKRLFVILLAAMACVGGGATAAVAAFVSEFRWPLSEANFDYSSRLGLYCGVAGALVATVCLCCVNRKHLWAAGAFAVAVTWLATFAGVWWHMVCGLG